MGVGSFKQGMFNWVELGTSNVESAKEFYAGLFGWDAAEVPMDNGMVYSILQLGGREVGALFHDTHTGAPPHWNLYVSVDNVDEAAAKVAGLGGSIVGEPFDVMDHGRMAVILDPSGATICAWQAKNHPGFSIMNEPGSFCWGELLTDNAAKAIPFYQGLFDWGISGNQDGSSEYTEFKVGSEHIGGMIQIKEEWGVVPPHWLPYFLVSDCDNTVEQAKSLGGDICAPAMDIQGMGRFAILYDLEAAAFAIFQLKRG